jgi:hypothetical protein
MSLGLDLDKHVTPVAMFILCPHYTHSCFSTLFFCSLAMVKSSASIGTKLISVCRCFKWAFVKG